MSKLLGALNITNLEFTKPVNLPPVISTLATTIPNEVLEKTTIKFKISGAIDKEEDELKYSIHCDSEFVFFNKKMDILENEEIELTVFPVANDKIVNYTIYCSDNASNISQGKEFSFTIKYVNVAPDVTNMATTLPNQIFDNQEYQFSFIGVVDIDDSTYMVDILEYPSFVNLSKTNAILKDELVTLTTLDLIRDINADLKVMVTDSANNRSVKYIPLSFIDYNRKPSSEKIIINGLTHNLGERSILSFTINGGSDPDGDSITYQITDITGPISLSKTTGILENEVITLTTDNIVTQTESAGFKVSVIDSKEMESNKKEFNFIVENIKLIPNNTTINWTGPVSINENSSITFTVDGGSSDDNNVISHYKFTDISPLIELSKIDNIVAGETIILSVPFINGTQNASFSVTAIDTAGYCSEPKIIGFELKNTNSPPNSNFTLANRPTLMQHKTTVSNLYFYSTDPDNDAVLFDIIAHDPLLTFSKKTNINRSELITITAGELPIGSQDKPVSFTVIAKDSIGEKTPEKVFTTTIRWPNKQIVKTNAKLNLVEGTKTLGPFSYENGVFLPVIFTNIYDPDTPNGEIELRIVSLNFYFLPASEIWYKYKPNDIFILNKDPAVSAAISRLNASGLTSIIVEFRDAQYALTGKADILSLQFNMGGTFTITNSTSGKILIPISNEILRYNSLKNSVDLPRIDGSITLQSKRVIIANREVKLAKPVTVIDPNKRKVISKITGVFIKEERPSGNTRILTTQEINEVQNEDGTISVTLILPSASVGDVFSASFYFLHEITDLESNKTVSFIERSNSTYKIALITEKAYNENLNFYRISQYQSEPNYSSISFQEYGHPDLLIYKSDAKKNLNVENIFKGISDVIINNEEMIKIPKFYISGDLKLFSGDYYFSLSSTPASGFIVHPAFGTPGNEKDYFAISKYQCGVKNGNTLSGNAGMTPPYLTFDLAKNYAINAGFNIWDIYAVSAIRMLMLVDCDFMNGGEPYFSINGSTLSFLGHVNNSPSQVLQNNNATVAGANYRGIIGIHGNLAQWVDGAITNTGTNEIMVWDNIYSKTLVGSGVNYPLIPGYFTNKHFLSITKAICLPAASGYGIDGTYSAVPTSSSSTEYIKQLAVGGNYNNLSVGPFFNYFIDGRIYGSTTRLIYRP